LRKRHPICFRALVTVARDGDLLCIHELAFFCDAMMTVINLLA
jgi:hypothetical protein